MDRLVLREDDIFAVSDAAGDIREEDDGGLGLYYRDTRYLSTFELTLNGEKLDILSSSSEQNFMANVQFANRTIEQEDGEVVLPHTISVRRNRFVKEGLHERIGLLSYNLRPVRVEIAIALGSDFRDMFDVRGYGRPIRGKALPPAVEDTLITLRYVGQDERLRETCVTFEQAPTRFELGHLPCEEETIQGATVPDANTPVLQTIYCPPRIKAIFEVVLKPHTPYAVTLHIAPRKEEPDQARKRFDGEVVHLRGSYEKWANGNARLETDNTLFNRLLQRSVNDLRILMQNTEDGQLPVAGIPWFACPFGRDSLIASYQTLIFNPAIAVGTLRFLAAHQGQKVDDWRDEEPGKILHELRMGELTSTGNSPHNPYYGSADSTPLFLMLFAETMSWLDDDRLYHELLPAAVKALEWIDRYGDLDGDAYVEYKTRSPRGLLHQGWKDSHNSLSHCDGRPVPPPVALVEIQGYVYAAKTGMADLLRRKGEGGLAGRLEEEARALKAKFNRDFWLDDERFLAQALDAEKAPVPAITSNPGHCLLAGIVEPDKAWDVVHRLMGEDMACGWGVRTLSSKMATFNPMSYHNGSIWPHDNALIVAGMKRYGYHDEANEIAHQLFQASLRFRYNRLPELFCGFARDTRYHSVPAEYPVSCNPQAWATGTAVLLFQSILGLKADAAHNRLILSPKLPDWIQRAKVSGLQIGRSTVDISVVKHAEGVYVSLTRNDGGVDLQVLPAY